MGTRIAGTYSGLVLEIPFALSIRVQWLLIKSLGPLFSDTQVGRVKCFVL